MQFLYPAMLELTPRLKSGNILLNYLHLHFAAFNIGSQGIRPVHYCNSLRDIACRSRRILNK